MAYIEKRSATSYKITVSQGYDSKGKKRRVSKYWSPKEKMTPRQIEKELNRVAVEFENQVISGNYLDPNTRFSDFVQEWIKTYAERELAPKTVSEYKRLLVPIVQYFDNEKLMNIQPHSIMKFYETLRNKPNQHILKKKAKPKLSKIFKEQKLKIIKISEKAGISEATLSSALAGKNINLESANKIADALKKPLTTLFKDANKAKPISESTINHYHRVLSSVLTSAVHWQLIPSNPCNRIKPPKIDKTDIKVYDEQQISKMFSKLDKEPEPYRTLIKLITLTGMRRGELLGLEWKDIDFDKCTISIERTSSYIQGQGYITGKTKTTGSTRTLSIGAGTAIMLKEFKQWQQNHINKIGDAWTNSDRLGTKWDGTPMYPDTISSWFRKFLKRAKLPPIRLHSLRHANATLQIADGVDIRTVSSRLGHAQTSTTLNIYAHAIQARDQAAADRLEQIIGIKSDAENNKK